MSPTLLEVTVAVLLLWVAWQVGLLIAPYVIRYFRKNFTLRDPLAPRFPSREEKNITPRQPPSSSSD